MVTGFPGLSTLFYIGSVLLMPLAQLLRRTRGQRGDLLQWRGILRHSTLSVLIALGVWAVSENMPEISALQPNGSLHPVWAWGLRTSALLLVLLVLTPWLSRAYRVVRRTRVGSCTHGHGAGLRRHPSFVAGLCPKCNGPLFGQLEP
jgi:hypothetical protein